MGENIDKANTVYSNSLRLAGLRIALSYVDGYSSLKFLWEILEVQQNDVEIYLAMPEFFNYLYGVCYQSAVINISNILMDDRKKESINIYHLNSIFENHLSESQVYDGYTDLYTIIQKAIETYSKENDFYLGLKELRDKYIAHIDKARFHSAIEPTHKISLDDIKCAYDFVEKLVAKMIDILGINPELIDFDQIEKANLQFRILIKELKSKSEI